jgi:hypothetical protein
VNISSRPTNLITPLITELPFPNIFQIRDGFSRMNQCVCADGGRWPYVYSTSCTSNPALPLLLRLSGCTQSAALNTLIRSHGASKFRFLIGF